MTMNRNAISWLIVLVPLMELSERVACQGCFGSTNIIKSYEDRVTDFSVPRTYNLCTGNIYEIGNYDVDGNLIGAGGLVYEPLPLHPNMKLICGDGSSSQSCTFIGGDLQMDGTDFFTTKDKAFDRLDGIEITGMTFKSTTRYTLWATRPGDITFYNCTFSENTEAIAPLYFDFYDPVNLLDRLDVSFFGCTFENNVYWGQGAQPAIITANGYQNSLTIDRANFRGNDMLFNNTNFQKASSLIESSGDTIVTNSCFQDNVVGVGLLVSYGAFKHETTNNFVLDTAMNPYGAVAGCAFAAFFETAFQYEYRAPRCVLHDVNLCLSDTTPSPTPEPTPAPNGSSPTSAPTPMPTPAGPSQAPIAFPTQAPVANPTEAPVADPTVAPSAASTYCVFISVALVISACLVV